MVMNRPFYMDYTTALVLVAPHEVQEIAVPILKRYAPDSLTLLPAHITLMFPFVKYEKLDSAALELQKVCAEIEPFDVTLDGYATFPGVTYMRIDDPTPIKNLFGVIFAAFPEHPPYGGTFGNDLQPHLTVAKFEHPRQQRTAQLPPYKPITFKVDRIHLTYGVHGVELPWITWEVLRLRG